LTAAIPVAGECSGREEKTAPQPNQKISLAVDSLRTRQHLERRASLRRPGGRVCRLQ
jgi:hypothetical protein